jgi:hypothetical protein
MRIILTLAILFTISFQSKADAWDNLTREEADAVVAYLEENPFIFSYCDCCSQNEGFDSRLYFLRVTSTEIIECSWRSEHYTVTYEYQIIGQFGMRNGLPDFSQFRTPQEIEEQYIEPFEFNDPIYMNYTWAYNPITQKATPFFEIIDYHYVAQYGGRSCLEHFSYPSPAEILQLGEIEGYSEWYNK